VREEGQAEDEEDFDDEAWGRGKYGAPGDDEAEEAPEGEEEKEGEQPEMKFDEPLHDAERAHQLYAAAKQPKRGNMHYIVVDGGPTDAVRADFQAECEAIVNRLMGYFRCMDLKEAAGDVTYGKGRRFMHIIMHWSSKMKQSAAQLRQSLRLGDTARVYISNKRISEMLELHPYLNGEREVSEGNIPWVGEGRMFFAILSSQSQKRLRNLRARAERERKREAEEKRKEERRQERERKRDEKVGAGCPHCASIVLWGLREGSTPSLTYTCVFRTCRNATKRKA
jgi:hypothetical protein